MCQITVVNSEIIGVVWATWSMKPDRKLRPVTPQDVEDWKTQCGAHKMNYVANFHPFFDVILFS